MYLYRLEYYHFNQSISDISTCNHVVYITVEIHELYSIVVRRHTQKMQCLFCVTAVKSTTMNAGDDNTANSDDDAEGVLDTTIHTILVSPGDLPVESTVRNAAANIIYIAAGCLPR